MPGRHRDLSAAPSRSARGAARRLKRRVRAAVAIQAALLTTGAIATAVSAGAETPRTALQQLAVRIHWAGIEAATARRTGPRQNKQTAMNLFATFGWPARGQFSCLERLWARESGWRTRSGSASGAYGIPQARPGSRMRSAGADWRTNPQTQIRWGLRYIRSRYGSPCHAWAHSLATGWY
jgi:hypothetical protein